MFQTNFSPSLFRLKLQVVKSTMQKRAEYNTKGSTSNSSLASTEHLEEVKMKAGSPGFLIHPRSSRYYTGPAGTGYPLPGSPDDTTDMDNAPKTDVKEPEPGFLKDLTGIGTVGLLTHILRFGGSINPLGTHPNHRTETEVGQEVFAGSWVGGSATVP